MLIANPNIEFIYKHINNNGEFIFNSTETKDVLVDIPLTNPEIFNALKELINENTKAI